MADQWTKIQILFTGPKPTEDQCNILTEALRNVFIDAPEVKRNGIDASDGDTSAFWLNLRAPLQLPMAMLHKVGFPNKGTCKLAQKKPRLEYPPFTDSSADYPINDADWQLFMEIWQEALEDSK